MRIARVESLDWLRGLMALSIMFYHLSFWLIHPYDSGSIIGRLGVYGVSVFFVLSGLSMAIVYHNSINNIPSTANFYLKRILRIWPLLWVVNLLIMIPAYTDTGTYDWTKFFLNITAFFGFTDPAGYIPVGAWSIGNEMVYYALTPLIIAIYNYRLWLGNLLFISSLLIGFYFSNFLLAPDKTLAEQWPVYANPFNNIHLYITGIFIFYNRHLFQWSRYGNYAILLLSVLLFCTIPFDGDPITIVTGSGRWFFVTLCFFIVASVYKLEITLPGIIRRPLEQLGLATYGIYLLHPVIKEYLSATLIKLNIYSDPVMYLLTVILTITISIYSYRLLESRIMRLARNFRLSEKTHVVFNRLKM